jgi:hypothetical protein
MKILGWTLFALGGGGFIFSIIAMVLTTQIATAGVAFGALFFMWSGWSLAHPKPKD